MWVFRYQIHSYHTIVQTAIPNFEELSNINPTLLCNILSLHQLIKLLFILQVAFPNLETLSLEWNYSAKESMNENFSGNSCKLKDLDLIDAGKEAALCPCFFLNTLPNLERLRVANGVLEEMFICKGHGCKEKYMAEVPSKLNYLRLGGLNDSLNLGEENSLLCKIFQNLTTLEISSCNKLKALVSSTVTFQNLTTLDRKSVV